MHTVKPGDEDAPAVDQPDDLEETEEQEEDEQEEDAIDAGEPYPNAA